MLKHNQAVRFWDYVTSEPVLIKIGRGQTLHHSHGAPTDEGWSRTSHVWHFDGDRVTCETIDDGVDCDGRLTRFSVSSCPVSKLRDGYAPPDFPGVRYPDWQSIDTRQRDYRAEAMGY